MDSEETFHIFTHNLDYYYSYQSKKRVYITVKLSPTRLNRYSEGVILIFSYDKYMEHLFAHDSQTEMPSDLKHKLDFLLHKRLSNY